MARSPSEAGIAVGQHLQVAADGTETLVRTAAPGAAWQRLLDGEVGPEGPLGMPTLAATTIPPAVLDRLGAVPPATDAALFDLLLRAEAAGIAIVEAEAILARRPATPDIAGWAALVRAREGDAAAARFVAAIDAARQAEAARRSAARPARIALGLVSALDRLSPRLADGLEGVLLGGAVRRVRALLRGGRRA